MQRRIGDAEYALAIAPEHGDARKPAALLGAIAHIGGEAGALVTHHWETPAPALREPLLGGGRIRRRDREGGAVGEVRIDAIEAVRPERAVAAGRAHVVDHDEIGFAAEERREAHGALGRRECVILDLLGLDRRLRLAHFGADAGDLLPIFGELIRGLVVIHRLGLPGR